MRVTRLSDAERDHNLQMLRFISDGTVMRGMQFNLALWSHAYEWPNADTNYRIEGLTPETHAAYCRDALTSLLKACPNITGLSFPHAGTGSIPQGVMHSGRPYFKGSRTSAAGSISTCTPRELISGTSISGCQPGIP